MAETLRMRVYGAWLYRGTWDRQTPPPGDDWKLIRMVPGRYETPPEGMEPEQGQVTLLMQGDSALVVIPD